MDGKDGVGQVIDSSIQQEKVICLECGKALQLLSHRHLATHGLTPLAYKRKHGLCLTQSLCTHALARRREALAQNLLANGSGAGGS
jgi:predicted transcriptional regulator